MHLKFFLSNIVCKYLKIYYFDIKITLLTCLNDGYDVGGGGTHA